MPSKGRGITRMSEEDWREMAAFWKSVPVDRVQDGRDKMQNDYEEILFRPDGMPFYSMRHGLLVKPLPWVKQHQRMGEDTV